MSSPTDKLQKEEFDFVVKPDEAGSVSSSPSSGEIGQYWKHLCSSFCRIQLFRLKGAQRKLKTDKSKIERLNPPDLRKRYQASDKVTLLNNSQFDPLYSLMPAMRYTDVSLLGYARKQPMRHHDSYELNDQDYAKASHMLNDNVGQFHANMAGSASSALNMSLYNNLSAYTSSSYLQPIMNNNNNNLIHGNHESSSSSASCTSSSSSDDGHPASSAYYIESDYQSGSNAAVKDTCEINSINLISASNASNLDMMNEGASYADEMLNLNSLKRSSSINSMFLYKEESLNWPIRMYFF